MQMQILFLIYLYHLIYMDFLLRYLNSIKTQSTHWLLHQSGYCKELIGFTLNHLFTECVNFQKSGNSTP